MVRSPICSVCRNMCLSNTSIYYFSNLFGVHTRTYYFWYLEVNGQHDWSRKQKRSSQINLLDLICDYLFCQAFGIFKSSFVQLIMGFFCGRLLKLKTINFFSVTRRCAKKKSSKELQYTSQLLYLLKSNASMNFLVCLLLFQDFFFFLPLLLLCC